MTTRTLTLIAFVVLLSAGTAFAEPTDPTGHIYGTVETSAGNSYTGFLRWNTEEAYWDDLFNSLKVDLPYLKRRLGDKDRRRRIKIFGVTVGYRWDDTSSARMFISRFGDIQEIRPTRGDKVEIVMKSGSKLQLDGGSNDIGTTIAVVDDSLGHVKVDWDKIDRIVFRQAPAHLKPEAYRLYGKVTTDQGVFEGFIQWDQQECLSTDKLDGDTDDGDLSIEMGRIRSIEKRNRKGSTVTLKDGRELILEGSNDVDSSLRGIFVEDKRYGRVDISWEAFEIVEFREIGGSGRSYNDYDSPGQLKGTVTDYNDRTYSGNLIFDLDESESWELLNGNLEDVEFHIPFAMIRSISPVRGDSSRVVLRNGTELDLDSGQDVSESNDGMVILRMPNEREMYVPWQDVKTVVFD